MAQLKNLIVSGATSLLNGLKVNGKANICNTIIDIDGINVNGSIKIDSNNGILASDISGGSLILTASASNGVRLGYSSQPITLNCTNANINGAQILTQYNYTSYLPIAYNSSSSYVSVTNPSNHKSITLDKNGNTILSGDLYFSYSGGTNPAISSSSSSGLTIGNSAQSVGLLGSGDVTCNGYTILTSNNIQKNITGGSHPFDGSDMYFSGSTGLSHKDQGNILYYSSSTLYVSARGKTTKINGDLTVNGNKNCVQKTEHYGKRLFYSQEDGESILTWSNKLKTMYTSEEDNTLQVDIDPIYLECVDMGRYIVNIYKIGAGDYCITEKSSTYFKIKSEKPNFAFQFSIKAHRKNYENKYLDEDIEYDKDVIK